MLFPGSAGVPPATSFVFFPSHPLDPADTLCPVMELGDLTLTRVSDGEFRLDGGAMFGVVPRVMWEKRCPPDDRNRIRMGTNCLLVPRGGDLLLIDTGIGDKHDPGSWRCMAPTRRPCACRK